MKKVIFLIFKKNSRIVSDFLDIFAPCTVFLREYPGFLFFSCLFYKYGWLFTTSLIKGTVSRCWYGVGDAFRPKQLTVNWFILWSSVFLIIFNNGGLIIEIQFTNWLDLDLTCTQFWNVPLSVSVKRYALRHWFVMHCANASHFRSLGHNFECVTSHAEKVAPCAGMTDTN